MDQVQVCPYIVAAMMPSIVGASAQNDARRQVERVERMARLSAPSQSDRMVVGQPQADDVRSARDEPWFVEACACLDTRCGRWVACTAVHR